MMLNQNAYDVIGLMSGTSLDGLDMVCCRFYINDESVQYEVLAWKELNYSQSWKHMLSNAFWMDSLQLNHLNIAFGNYLGQATRSFIRDFDLNPQIVSSHGHTVFHRPAEKVSLQIGDGQSIADQSGVLTINNFRQADVLKGGQGAPLVPIGDSYLFGDYHICLNIGGIANLSFEENGQRRAFDIGPANMVLNFLAGKLGFDFDMNGVLAGSGKVDELLVGALNNLPYFFEGYPKSLGREWVEQVYLPVVLERELDVCDLLASCTHQIAYQIARATDSFSPGKILVTGGGAYNKTLISELASMTAHEIFLPDDTTIRMKEAIVFALLGLLRFLGKVNCLSSVTGAHSDSSTGDIYTPQSYQS